MRNFHPLDITPLPDLTGDTEVLLLTSNLESSPGETWRQSIALVMISPSDLQRRQARALVATYITITGSFHSPSKNLSLGDWLVDKLVSTDPDSIVVILALPEGHPTSGGLVAREFPKVLRDHLKERLDLLLLVTSADLVLPGGFHSLVQGDMEQALQALELISTLMAPKMLPCCDVYDLIEAMPPDSSFRIVPAAWLLDDERLLLPSTEAQAWLTSSSHIVLGLQTEGRTNAVMSMANGIRSLTSHDANLLLIHGVGHRTTPHAPPPLVQPILILLAVAPQA